MIGKPKYNLNDEVSFEIGNNIYTGKIFIIDKYGTFEDDSDVSYDIMVDEPYECLFKHIREDYII